MLIGIDLGTTYSAAAYIDQNGQPQIIPNREGENTTPSVVMFEDGDENKVVVGSQAKECAKIDPYNVVEFIKRQTGQADWTFDCDSGKTFKMEEISALILKRIVSDYRRCTWTVKGKKKYVWRCISRLDFGKKYCHESPTIEESVLHEAIMRAVMKTAQINTDVLNTLKLHIGMALTSDESEDTSLALQIRIAEIDAEFTAMLKNISSDSVDAFDENKAKDLMNEKSNLQQQLSQIADTKQKCENAQSRLDDIYTILDGLKNHPMQYDDRIVRQIIECVVVESKEEIKVIFIGGNEVTEKLVDSK